MQIELSGSFSMLAQLSLSLAQLSPSLLSLYYQYYDGEYILSPGLA